MQIKVITDKEVKCINQVVEGELLLCEDGKFYPVKSVLITGDYGKSIRTSNNIQITIPDRFRIKTDKGFKYPELWDTIPINEDLTPMITNIRTPLDICLLYDILIEGNMVSPDGIVFRFSNL
jgi:hypothetical protein